MFLLNKLEAYLDELINLRSPLQQPEETRESLARAWWWIALVVGVVQLYGAWVLWNAGAETNQLIDATNELTQGAEGDPLVRLGFFYYFAVFVLLVDAAILLLAAPGLKRLDKARGWNLLFYGFLVSLLFGMVRLFTDVSGQFIGFVLAVLSSLLGIYFLFQTRRYFLPPRSGSHKVGVEKTTRKTV